MKSYSNPIFSFLKNHHNVSHRSCTSLHSHQQCRRALFSLYFLQQLLFVNFLKVAILTGMRGYFTVVLIYVSLIISRTEHFSCACWPPVSLLRRNVCLGFLPPSWLGCLFLWYWVVWALFIFSMIALCWLHYLKILSLLLGSLFIKKIFFMSSLAVWKLLNLIRPHLFIF